MGPLAVANRKHLKVAKRGAKSIRAWRDKHPEVESFDLYGADLYGANLSGANLRGADLRGANLSETDLYRAGLRGANLNEAHLRGANLRGAHLNGADMSGADLSGANLSGANLKGADLSEANLSLAYLNGADLSGAHLSGANLNGADLSGADLTESFCSATVFAEVDLSTVRGLETVRHTTPSTVGIDTLYRSKGNIPAEFLQGCGVPDGLITYLSSLIGAEEAALFYSCFISYSHKDEEFAEQIYSRMREEHLRVWYAPQEMKGGRKLHEQIYQAIGVYDKLLLVLSKNSMKSDWVASEIRRARKAERETGHRKLFPIRLVDFETIKKWECFDADSGKDLGIELREYYIPDFSNWSDADAFEASFGRLLKDLRAEEKAEDSRAGP